MFLLSIAGGIVAVDTAAAWQIMISQPVVICPVLGLLFSQPEIGLTMGILLEMPWLVNIPCGGKHGTEGNLGAVAATGMAIYFNAHHINTVNIIVVISIIYGLGVARFGKSGVEYVRRINLSLIHKADKAALKGDVRQIESLNYSGVLYFFVMGFVLIGFSLLIGFLLVQPLIKFIHPNFNTAFGLAKYAILGVGFGGIVTLFMNRETKWYFFIPFLAGLFIWIVVFVLF